ncbi:uncharacterized protein ACNLHF_009075 [Anomaloglossus baeobatrachus]
MESRLLGRRFHLTSSVTSLRRIIQEILILSLLCRESLSFALSASAASDQTKYGYKQTELSNGTANHSTTVKCLVQKSNETFGDYRFTKSVGDVIYVFGFIGILIVLKSLLTKITMVENKSEDSDYVMSTCATQATYKTTLQKCTNNNNVLMTPPNSPCLAQSLSPPITSTPVSFNGNRCYPLSNLEGGHLYYTKRFLFSSPEGSTKSLV